MKKLTLVVLAGLLLAGCEKPTPTVTAATVGSSERAKSICWSTKAEQAIGSDCSVNQALIKSLRVTPGEFVGFSVDPEIAESGWLVFANGTQVTQRLTKKYYRFNTAENSFQNGPLQIEIYALTNNNRARGVWGFTLTEKR